MTNAEKIKAIRHQITLFGGTCVSLENAKSIIGFNKPTLHDNYYMLRGITADEKLLGRNDDGDVITIPIHWFSENYLYSVLNTYVKACKEQLSDYAFKKIEEIIK